MSYKRLMLLSKFNTLLEIPGSTLITFAVYIAVRLLYAYRVFNVFKQLKHPPINQSIILGLIGEFCLDQVRVRPYAVFRRALKRMLLL